MPYTPPSQRSPASSKTSSPIISRTHSYTNFAAAPAPTQRPALPRSVSSTSYLHKQRRSPSFPSSPSSTDANGLAANGGVDIASDADRARGLSRNGAITTPPDSSDDDERGRSIGNLRELEQALQHINVKRESSPSHSSPRQVAVTVTPTNTPQPMTAARSLSVEARKIAHSRSSSDIMLSKHVLEPLMTDTIISSDDSDAEDDDLRMKPPLLRKKSGELVRPALRPPSRRRPSSMPGTPTYSKAVHFNENMEQVRHFLHADRPIAVSVGSSPVQTYDSETEYPFEEEDSRDKTPEWEIKLANFPTSDSYERQTSPVRVERIFLASDNQTLVGNIACANISFQKLVVARFTLDYWKTTSEVVAEFNHDVRKKHKDDGHDRFNFNIKLADQANLESKTLLLCVRYQVNGQEFWDSNNNMNYQVDFTKKTKQHQPRQSKRSNVALGAIPRSRHSPVSPRPRFVTADDDFGHDSENKFEFGSREPAIRLKPKSKRGVVSMQAPKTQAGLAFSARYDFGASLSAALSTAQTALGDRSGIKNNGGNMAPKGYFDRPAAVLKAHTTGAPIPGTRPNTFSAEKPDLQSAEYNELIQKFCFVRSQPQHSSKQA
ncbi:carbohydrate-binding module family 21 protein [Dothidotthia symphoricarpi CBS 119687]|uniref:Carbohydrate-binding module family 21 protein n=1 Tax=Dothidotthia symphoricarpi CBS 119687 TaxID=1392245 RepID=A0A6A6A2N8_9PLEO|nr:carbohydrate-binding module family 21 protein [Dothidotthia symphoricarpi CBS 119687]KAF2126119.1 carbohydrate-binding module family 21 protein [Dothidotthia symphoricarpi CBS 119687]